jgi:hypothetical protein
MTRTAAGADGNFALGNLAGIAGLTTAADLSLYYNGTAWATYTVTSVGRTLLAATTQAAQRTALGAADDTAVVHIAGTETITGAKTFNGILTATGNIVSGNNFTTSTAACAVGPGSAGSVFIRPSGIGSTTGQWAFSATVTRINCDVTPATDNAFNVGSASLRPIQYFGVNGTINTSDARLKTEPRQLSEAERKAGSELARLPAIWEWLTGDRLHAGPTVQAAMAVMKAHGLDPFAYSFICYDEWEAEPEQWHEWPAKDAVLDDDGNELEPAIEAGRELIQPAREAGDRYSFRKEELLCFMVSALAAENDLQAAKVEALDARLAALEAKA